MTINLTPNARQVLDARYLRSGESPEERFRAVARAVANGGQDEDAYYRILAALDFLPNTPTLSNAGRDRPLGLHACYVLPISDSLTTEQGSGILDIARITGLIHQSGGGTGFDFSSLRPSGYPVRTTNGVSSGPVAFIQLINDVTDAIKQGGIRRGANMAIMSVSHPDIHQFVAAKTEEGKLANFNISVSIPDDFMKAVENDQPWTTHFWGNSTEINARKMWSDIVDAAWRYGDPGVVFIDQMNRDNPLAGKVVIDEVLGEIDCTISATNPCVTGDAWVMTSDGARQVIDLVDKPADLVVDGVAIRTTGFFRTGTKPIMRLSTEEGHELDLTADHLVAKSTLTRYTNESEWVRAGDLRPGDLVRLNDHRILAGWQGAFTFGEGYLVGSLIGDGTFGDYAELRVWDADEGQKNEILLAVGGMKHRSDFAGWRRGRDYESLSTAALTQLAESLGVVRGHKYITTEIERGSSEFYAGFLRGLFDADGSVQGEQDKGVSVRLAQSDRVLLAAAQRMLLRLGVASRIYFRREAGSRLLPNGAGGLALYECREQWELVITNENITRYSDLIGFSHSVKSAKLKVALASYRRAMNRERFVATVQSVTPIGEQDVYDVRVPVVHAFDANGLLVHNCGEVPLIGWEACTLGSINLSHFVNNGKPRIDRLREVTRVAIRFLDDVVTLNRTGIPQIDRMTQLTRRIGLGVMGWADMLNQLGIPYDSSEALSLAREVALAIRTETDETSHALAIERGPYPLSPDGHFRNIARLSIAPTGSISTIADCSAGIEPYFSRKVTRKLAIGTLYEEYAGSDQPHFRTAMEIDPEWHVRMQAAWQAYVDNGVSKTVNLPSSATPDDVRRVYELAYELGTKGVTIYRDGSRDLQVYNAVGDSTEHEHPTVHQEGCVSCPTCGWSACTT